MKYVHQWLLILMLLTIFGCVRQMPQEEVHIPPEETDTPVKMEISHWVPSPDDCLVYSPNPIPNETITWSGDCIDGKASGSGELTWYLHGEATGLYTGEFSEGKPLEGGDYQHLTPPIRVEQLPSFTVEKLAKYTGKQGTPAYVAYKGKVYDVSHSFSWVNGEHQMSHWAGEELTESYERSSHSFKNLLEPYPIVGIFVQE